MTDNAVKRIHRSFLRRLRAVIIAGLVVTVPIGLTIWVLVWLFEAIDRLLRPLTVYIFGQEVIGVGFGVIVLLVIVVGLIATNVIGKRVVRWGEELLSKVPISRVLYNTLKQIFQSFADPKNTGFLQVVLVEFPRKGIYALGFVTNIAVQKDGRKILNVFIPTSPNPTGGFLQILDESQVVYTKMTVEEGLKIVVSAGRISPGDFTGSIISTAVNITSENNAGKLAEGVKDE